MREVEEYLAHVGDIASRPRIQEGRNLGLVRAAAAAIVGAAAVQKADLIVMSTHGRSGIGRLILGSVAESVLRGTTTPILLLRAAGAPVVCPQGDATSSVRTTEAHQ
jgi:universal stress protein A